MPYDNAFLPAMKIPPLSAKKKGTIIMHGGFDSFIEEFYSWMRYFSDLGYEVIAFEGPGQGAARKKYELALDYEWEKPAKAVLDYFKQNNVIYLRNLTNNMAMKTIKKGKGMEAWMTSNLTYITKKNTPADAFEVWLQLNERNLHSDLVRQDVLILTGREDHFIPFKMHHMQVKALTNAKSVTARAFTKEEQAQNHCQIGNIGLALDVMVNWIENKS